MKLLRLNKLPTIKENIKFIGLMLVFIGVNIALMAENQYWLSLLPALILVLWLLVFEPRGVVLFIAMAAPLSIKVNFEDYGLSINLPTEPFLILLTGLFWLKMIIDWKYDYRIFKHPITLAILFNLLWILVTAFTSTMVIVSLKFFIARFWFVTVSYFMCVLIFKHFSFVKSFIWLFCSTLCIAILWGFSRHAAHMWSQEYSSKAVNPFFTDHGIYAAVISLFLPIMIFFSTRRKVFGLGLWQQFFALIITTLFILGIIFSYTRAAWIGLGVSAGFLVIIIFRIRFYLLCISGLMVLGILYMNRTQIYLKLKANKRVSASNVEQHLQSIYNISTDASNTERINRWSSAYRMWEEKPIFGWGPGTYMFQYGPFQLYNEMTIISTRSGRLGNAHSEYIGPLAESGVLGTISFAAILLITIARSMTIIYKSQNKKVRYTAIAIILGLITYYTHGFLNNYLDIDKAAVPFWAFTAIITALDIYYYLPEKNNSPIPET